jgi:hypothetical protein
MEWQARANKIAGRVRCLAILLLAPEVYDAIQYHFPLWDDIAMPLTLSVHLIGGFVQKYTAMYRIDL